MSRTARTRRRADVPNLVSPSQSRAWIWPAALIVITWAVFWPLLTFDFVSWDDHEMVSRNPLLNPVTGESFLYYWVHPKMDLYIPVTYVVWTTLGWLNQLPASGDVPPPLSPALFHAANLIVHTGAAIVVFALLRRLIDRSWPAFVGAAVFALHPLQVEPVAWISGLKDVLCGLLIWTAIWLYVEFRHAGDASPRRWIYYASATAVYVLAMLAKPTAVIVPALAAIIDLFVLRRSTRQTARTLLPWFALAIPCFLWTRHFQPAEFGTEPVPLLMRPLIATDALAFYLVKLFWPAQLTIDYGRRPDVVLEQGWAYYTWLLPLAAAVLLWRARKSLPLAVAGAIVLLLCLAPVLGLIRFDFQEFSTVADHYVYPAMVGVAMIVADVARRANPKLIAAVALPLLLALGVRSWLQTDHWRNDFTLFHHTLDVTPESWAAHNSLGAAYLEGNNADRALHHAGKTATLAPHRAPVFGTLGAVLAAAGRFDEAAAAYQQSLSLHEGNPRIHSNLAGLLAHMGRFDAATHHARRALELDPNDPQALLNLGSMLAQTGRADAGIELLRRAIRLNPRDPRARTNLGFILLERGRIGEAEQLFQAVLHFAPDFEAARRGMDQVRAAKARGPQ